MKTNLMLIEKLHLEWGRKKFGIRNLELGMSEANPSEVAGKSALA